MIEVGFVQFEQIIVAAKDEIDVPGFFIFTADDGIQPFPEGGPVFKGERNALTEKLDWNAHILLFCHCFLLTEIAVYL